MLKLSSIYLFLITTTCLSIANAQQMTDEQLANLHASVAGGFDPYFIESRDTVSVFGPDCITRDLLQDKKGDYWLATWKGIIKYDGKVFTNYTLKDGLIHFHVASCYEDRKGNLWFGTVRGGLYRYNDKVFKLFTTKNGLADNFVSCFAEDEKGNLWFGTDQGVSCYNGDTITNFTMKDGLPSNRVNSIIVDRQGQLWFSCGASRFRADDGGIAIYNGKFFEPFICNGKAPFANPGDLFEDKEGNVWIGGIDGLSRYDGKSVTGLANYLCYYITEDSGGTVWLTISEPPGGNHPNTPNQMLYSYNGKKFTKVLEKYEPDDCQIFGKIVDKKGNVWFGTMIGLCRYDGKTFSYFKDKR